MSPQNQLDRSSEDLIDRTSSRDALPEYLQTLLDGTEVSIRRDLKYPFEKPDWLDMDRVRRGQKFAMDHLFGLMNANGLSVLLVSVYQTILQPLIYTGKSATPFTAYKRYLATVTYVQNWFEGDLWEDGTSAHKSMKVVRGMHERIKTKLDAGSKEEIDKKITLAGTPMWTTLHEELLEDFKESCPELKTPVRTEKYVYVNQADLVITQFSFLGLIVLNPTMFGIHNVSDEVLNDFLHLWRAIGFLIGIEDRYNLCDGDVHTVRQRGRQLLDFWLKPLLRQASEDWVHMGRCLMTGVGHYALGTTYETSMLYLCKALGLKMPRLEATLTFGQRVMFRYTCFLYGVLFRWRFVWTVMNWLLNTVTAKGRNPSPAFLKAYQNKVYGYETVVNKTKYE